MHKAKYGTRINIPYYLKGLTWHCIRIALEPPTLPPRGMRSHIGIRKKIDNRGKKISHIVIHFLCCHASQFWVNDTSMIRQNVCTEILYRQTCRNISCAELGMRILYETQELHLKSTQHIYNKYFFTLWIPIQTWI